MIDTCKVKFNTKIKRASEWFKQLVKIDPKERACQIKRKERKVESRLSLDLQRLLAQGGETPGVFKYDMRTIKANFELMNICIRGRLVPARAEKVLVGETHRKRAFSLENKYASGYQSVEIDYQGAVSVYRDLKQKAFVKYYMTFLIKKNTIQRVSTRLFNDFTEAR